MTEEDFIRAFHRAGPGATAASLARGRVVGHPGSSYDLLADAVAVAGRVLDLGCGDGYLVERLRARGHRSLVGLDVSLDELHAARARGLPASWLHARAQAIPLAAASCTAVASHLGFTLMPDLDAIVAELHRVLAPGGTFAAVVGGGPRGDDAFAGLLDLERPYAAAAPPTPSLGDRRARTDAGLASLFAAFHALTITDVTIDLSGTADQVWHSLSPAYQLATLTAHARAALHAEFLSAAPRWQRSDGLVSATMYARLVIATR